MTMDETPLQHCQGVGVVSHSAISASAAIGYSHSHVPLHILVIGKSPVQAPSSWLGSETSEREGKQDKWIAIGMHGREEKGRNRWLVCRMRRTCQIC